MIQFFKDLLKKVVKIAIVVYIAGFVIAGGINGYSLFQDVGLLLGLILGAVVGILTASVIFGILLVLLSIDDNLEIIKKELVSEEEYETANSPLYN